MNKNSRDETFTAAIIPDNQTESGLRQISMGSIALLQLVNNPLLPIVLNGGSIPYDKTLEILQFLWLHKVDENLAARAALRYKDNPDYLNEQVIAWSLSITPDQMLAFIDDILRDQSNISNSKSRIIPEKGSKSRKNQQSQIR